MATAQARKVLNTDPEGGGRIDSSNHMQEEVARWLLWLSREVHRYVPDFEIGHVSGWQPMASLPPVYRDVLVASSISMFTSTWLKEP